MIVYAKRVMTTPFAKINNLKKNIHASAAYSFHIQNMISSIQLHFNFQFVAFNNFEKTAVSISCEFLFYSRKCKMRYLFIFYYCLINAIIFGWNLDTYDDTGINFLTNNTDYVVVHVSVFYIRAFLTLKSIHKNSTNR